jgi:hypothetical protein
VRPEVMKALVAAGATAEMLISALEAEQASEEARTIERRAKAADRKRRSRAMSRGQGVTERDNRGRGVTEAVPLSPPSSPKEVSPYNPLQEITPPTSSIPNSRPAVASDFPPNAFELFWQKYPRREGKAAAKKKFEQVRKSGHVGFEKLIAAVNAYALACRGTEIRYVKQPTTWLTAGCWDDEIPTQAHGPPPSIAAGLPSLKSHLCWIPTTMTKTSALTTKLQSRELAHPDPQTDRLLSVSHNGIELVGGRSRLIRPIDPAVRAKLEQRKKVVDEFLTPANDAMDRMRIGHAVAAMLAGILNARVADPRVVPGAPTETYRDTFVAERSGEVFLYVNDAVLGLPWLNDLFYGNNKGTAKISMNVL